jgi:hypothetical protein
VKLHDPVAALADQLAQVPHAAVTSTVTSPGAEPGNLSTADSGTVDARSVGTEGIVTLGIGAE